MRFRVIATLAVLIAAIGVLVGGVSNAAAGVHGGLSSEAVDPQYTNIPYLAWAGSTVKISRCIGIGRPDVTVEAVTDYSNNNHLDINKVIGAEFDSDIWTGDSDQKPFFTGTAAGTGDETSRVVDAAYDVPGGGICWSTYITSDKAGMQNIKFSISLDLDSFLRGLNQGDQLVFESDILVIWMLDSAPTLTESPDVGDYKVGDPGGSGSFSPIKGSDGKWHLYPGLVEATVTGTFPIGSELVTDYSGTLLKNGTITLPNDWPWLAEHFAEDASLDGSAYGGAAANDWDIHDDDLATEGHYLVDGINPADGCADMPATNNVDAVDNCLGASGKTTPDPDLGPFSSIFGMVGTHNDAWGPFDPIRGFETLLSDGNLTPDDAPMPALEVDVALLAGSNVGSLSKADKSAIYNRNTPTYGGSTANIGNPHMLYAPFYKAYIPASLPFVQWNGTSGVAGTGNADFRNYLTLGLYYGMTTSDTLGIGKYDYWDTFTFDSWDASNNCKDVLGHYIEAPSGADEVAVYTDEHGQAFVTFNPANGTNSFDGSGEGIVLTPNSNNRCDVYTGSLTGTADIQAVSVYPGQPPADPANSDNQKTSNILHKVVNFTPLKVLNCVHKATNEAYCVETVTDFEGNPVKAAVEFSAQGPTGTLVVDDPVAFGGYDPTGQTLIGKPSDHMVDIWTSPTTGEAAVDVISSDSSCIDVAAENVGTRNPTVGIFRYFDFNPTTGTACGTNKGTGPTDGGTTSTVSTGTTSTGTTSTTSTDQSSGSQSQTTSTQTTAPVVLANVTAPAPTVQAPAANAPKTHKIVKVTLVSAHVVSTRAGRYLNVRVNSSARTATLRITLISKSGAKHIVLRTVKTNHVVRVGNLKLAPSTVSVKVAIA